jgi:hypothetical protein
MPRAILTNSLCRPGHRHPAIEAHLTVNFLLSLAGIYAAVKELAYQPLVACPVGDAALLYRTRRRQKFGHGPAVIPVTQHIDGDETAHRRARYQV